MEVIEISDSESDEIIITGYNPSSTSRPKIASQKVVSTQTGPANQRYIRTSAPIIHPASLLKRAAPSSTSTSGPHTKRQCIEISDDDDIEIIEPSFQPLPVKLEEKPPQPPPSPCTQSHTLINRHPTNPVDMDLDIENEFGNTSDEIILTETECLSDEDNALHHSPSPVVPKCFSPPPNLNLDLTTHLEGLTLSQHGDALTAHSDSVPLNYSQLVDILPSKLRTTADHLIGHFYKMKCSVNYAEEKPVTCSTRRKRKLRQMLTKTSEFRLGGGIESLSISPLGVIASSSSKGSGAVDEDSDPDPYNLPNNLAMYSSNTDQVQYLNKHSRTLDRAGGKAIKYYAVSNVAVDSTRPDHFYSVGQDKCLRQWKVSAENCIEVAKKSFPNGSPFYVGCHPDRPLLAVGCMDGSLFYAHTPYDTGISFHRLNLAEDGSAHAGNLAWGTGPSDSLLFSCVESLAAGSQATNKYFDIRTGYSSSFTQPGLDNCNMSLSNQGTSVALCGHNLEKDLGELLFFDIRTNPKPTHYLSTGTFASDVSTMAFSPDDIYLAVGREDNIIQVWDTRYVSTSPLLQLCHFNGLVPEDEAFGVARNLQWVDHRHRLGAGLGLVTGGDGGSLCLWDIQKAEGARQVIAELAFSITTVLIPDPTQYPQVRVIIGDAGGNVTIYQ